MVEYKEPATYMFNNFELKRWLHGDENRRRMLLVKLKNDLRNLGLSKRATRAGLVQLAMKPCVILKRLSVSCYRKKLLQSSHSNFIPIHKETNYRDDAENNRLEDNSYNIVQHTFDAQIPNTVIGITLINAVNDNKTCQNKIQECDLFRKESSDDTKQDFNKKVATNISHIDITSTNYRDIFAKKSAIEASPSFSSSEDESLNKHIQNIVHKFINKSLDTIVPFQLKEHSDSKSSIDPLKDVFRGEHTEKKDCEIRQEFFPVKSKLLDISQEDSYKSKTDNILENNISSSNAIISQESKTYAKVKVINFVGKIQNVFASEKSEKSIEHIDTLLRQTPIKEDINKTKIYLESKNSQTESQPIKTDSKTVIKRKIRSESLDRNISLIKKPKKNEVNMSPKKVVADSTIGTSHYAIRQMLSDNELVHTGNEKNEESTKCITERGSSKFLKRISERHRKKDNMKIIKIRAKFHECFRGNFDTDTSESEEEREILLNLKKNKQQFGDTLHNSITEEKVEYIFERNKLTHDLSVNNWQKNIESTIPDKIRSDNLYDSTVSDKEYDTVIKNQIEDSASLDKYTMLTNNSQESTENINSDNLCDSSTYAEKFDASDATTDKEMILICKCISTSVNASQKDIDNIYSDISCDSDACTEKYSPSNVITDEEIKEEALVCEHGISDNNFQEKFKNSNNPSTYKKKYAMKEKNVQDGATVYNYDTSINNSQEDMDVSAEVRSDNSSDSSNCTEKYCATNVIVTKKEIKSKALICTNDTLTNNSQENIENAILAEAKSDNLRNSIARTKKCDITIKKKKINDESINDESICILPDNSQKNIESAISLEVMADNSCNSTVNTGKYIKHNTITDEKKDGASSIYKHSTSNNSCVSIPNIEKYSTHNIVTDEKTEDEASTYKCDTPVNNSQENIESIIPIEVQFDNSCDSECEINSTVNVEKYDSMHDTAKDKVKNRISICKRNISANKSKNIGNVVSAEKEGIQNSSSIDTENNSKCDISAKHNIPSMIEINVDENMSIENIYLNKNIKKKADTSYKEAEEVSVQNLQKNQEMRNVESIDLAQHKNMQKNAPSNLELLIISTFESTSCNVGKKDSRDMLEKNVENLLLSSNDNMEKDEKTIDQLSMITSKLKKNSSEEKSDSFSTLPSNSSSKSNYSDNCSLDIHLTDDDNSSDIEVEIKIKPKLKSRVSRKFSLKAPWSALNTCIKNLHILKDNPSFLNKLLQMGHRTSEEVTNTKEKKDDTSLDNNVTAETDEIIYNSSPTIKDDENHSQQRNSQDPILNEDKNMIACDDKKDKDKCTQSPLQTVPITTENNLDSTRLVCDISDLGKQSQKIVANDKQKNNEEQNFQDKTILEGIKNVEHKKRVEEVEILSIERKKPQITTKNNLESIKAAYDTPDVAEQLSQTSSDMTHKKVRVRSIAELSYQCIEKSVNLTASIPRSACSAFCQSVSQSTTVHSISSQLAPQSTSFQSAPSQSIAFQPILPQSTCPQLGRPLLVPPRFTFPQSTSQSASKRLSPPSYNTTLKHTYLSPNTSSAVAPVEVNIPNNNNTLRNLIQITIKNICTNVGYCRNLDQYNHVRINFPEDYVQRLSITMQQISQDLENLKTWLYMKDIDSTLIYVNFYMPKNYPVTVPELKKYVQICYDYLHISQQNYANSSQYPKQIPINRLISNASMSNVNAQQFSRNISFPDTRMLNRDTFMQSSTMPCPAPTISNINQQQLVRNSANSTQVSHSRQSRSNIHQSYMSYVPFTAQSRIPNANQQQSLENASYLIQGRYMPANILNVGVQQDFLIMNNISSSNVNMRSREPVNQGNANVSPTTNIRQLHTLQQNTISNTATASAANNVQQQKSMYLQTSQIRTAVHPSPMTNQNNSLGIRQTVSSCDNVNLSGSFTINPDISRINAAMENARHGSTNVNQQQANCSPQVSQLFSGKTQHLPQYNPNQTYLIVSQSAQSNIQTHPVQNTLPNQNVWQIQQQLAVNQVNTNMPPTTNRKQSYIVRNVVSNTTTEKSQRYILPKDTSKIYPIDLSINDIPQNVQQSMSQQKLPINQGNPNMPPIINMKQSHITSKNPINSTTVTNQYVISKDTSIYPINLSTNNTLQNVQENVLNKEGEMTESQNTNRMQKKAHSMNLQQDTHQEILSACNKLQNVDNVSENTRSFTQRLSVLQSMMSTISPNKNDAVLFLSAIERKKQRNKVTFPNNLAILTDIQKILLRDQIKSYFIMWDELKKLLSKQGFERIHNERIILFYSYVNLDDYIKSIINESQTIKKSIEKSLQDNTSQNKSTLQEDTIQTSVDKLTILLNQDNENSLECNRILEKQSEQSIDPNISKGPKSTAVKSNLEASKSNLEESPCTSVVTKESLPKDTRLHNKEQDNILKKQSQKDSLIDTEKEPRSTETLSPEEKLITEVSAKNLKTQDNVKINESLKVTSSYDLSLKQNLLFNLLQDMSTENTKDQSEITTNNINKRFRNIEMESVCETSDIVTLNSSKQNDTISRAQYNVEDQNEIVYNINNETFNKNLRDGMRDNMKANIEILNSTKIQSDSLNILHISESSSSNNIQESISPRKYLGKKCKSIEISEPHIADKEHAEATSEFCLNIQQQDLTNEQSNDSTETFESFGKLYIDESVEMQTQCDKMSFFEEDNLKLQDSIELLDTISCDSTKVTSFSFLKNTAKADLSDTYQDFKIEAQNIEELDEEHQSLEIEKMQLQNVSLNDECNVRESVIQSTNIIKKHEDTTKENNELLITEEIEFQEMSSNRKVSKDTLHVEESMTESIYLKYPEAIEEKKMEINAQKLPEDIEEEKIELNAQKLPEDIEEEIDYTIIKMDNKNSEQSLLKIEKVGFQKMSVSSKFRDPEDISSIEDNLTESIYFQLPEVIEEETINIDTQELKYIKKKKTKMDTHSGIKAINKQLKHVSEQKYRKSHTLTLNSFQRDDFLDVDEKEVSAKTDFRDADDIEYISLKSDDSNSMPSILNIRSISPSSFEKMKNINAFFENNSESLTKNDENSLDINDNLGISDEIDDRLCLRCKRKSMVYCQACLEAHYCSKRCSSLHWNAEHYKQCKGRNSIICIDE